MAWAKIDDRFFMNPKIMQAGLEARALYVSGLCYCAGELTDGFIAASSVRKLAILADVEHIESALQKLLDLGLWEDVDDGYQVHDYLEYNPSREKVLATREARAEAGSKGGKQRASNLLEAGYDAASDIGEAKSNPVPVPHPVPVPEEDPQNVTTSAHAREIAETLVLAPWVGDGLDDVARAVDRSLSKVPQFDAARDGPLLAEQFVNWRGYRKKPPANWYSAWLNWLRKERDDERRTPNNGTTSSSGHSLAIYADERVRPVTEGFVRHRIRESG